MEYLYNALGEKLGKLVDDHTVSPTVYQHTEYLGVFQYVDDKLQFFPTGEGYVSVIDNAFRYVYNYVDHLGNIRLSYTKPKPSEPLAILEESHYYPFGMKHSNYAGEKYEYVKLSGSDGFIALEAVERSKYQYKYNGKEFQDELSLNWYDYQARNYDPAIGRWMNIDPLAEMSRRFSPYTYALNNPVFFIDPDGMMADVTDPVKKVISLQKTGNVNPVQVSYSNQCLLCGSSQKSITPTSQNSGSGKMTEISKMKEAEHGFIYDVMTGGTPEFTLSVTSTETSVNSQYFDASGNKVENISDASSFTTTSQTTTTTVNVGMGEVASEASVTKSSSTSTYKVSRDSNSKLQRGYSLTDGKTTSSKPTTSTVKTSGVSSTLQNAAKQEAKQNFVEGAKAVFDELQKMPESMDRNFQESLKKL